MALEHLQWIIGLNFLACKQFSRKTCTKPNTHGAGTDPPRLEGPMFWHLSVSGEEVRNLRVRVAP